MEFGACTLLFGAKATEFTCFYRFETVLLERYVRGAIRNGRTGKNR